MIVCPALSRGRKGPSVRLLDLERKELGGGWEWVKTGTRLELEGDHRPLTGLEEASHLRHDREPSQFPR